MHSFPYFAISEAGMKAPLKLSLSGTSAAGSMPNDASGSVAKYVLLTTDLGAYVRFGRGAQTAVNTDMMIPPQTAIAVPTYNMTHVAALQFGTNGVLNVIPLEAK